MGCVGLVREAASRGCDDTSFFTTNLTPHTFVLNHPSTWYLGVKLFATNTSFCAPSNSSFLIHESFYLDTSTNTIR